MSPSRQVWAGCLPGISLIVPLPSRGAVKLRRVGRLLRLAYQIKRAASFIALFATYECALARPMATVRVDFAGAKKPGLSRVPCAHHVMLRLPLPTSP